MTPAADAALAYAGRGLAVVPVHRAIDGRCSCGRTSCPSPGKHPRVRWQALQHEAPDAGQIAAWWRRWPDANVAVLTGEVSQLVVLDVDPRNGGDGELAGLEARFGALPSTPEVRTGGGGRHLWFRWPESRIPTGPIAPGLDVKGEGGMVMSPPSVHPSGGTYEWAAQRGLDDVPLAALPWWLTRLALDVPGHHAAQLAAPIPPRTTQEQRDFADTWGRAGVDLRAGDGYYLCPFHPDHHPSLHIDAEGCRWYCFGCRRGGGIAALRREVGEAAPARPWPRVRRSGPAPGPVTMAGDEVVDVVGEGHFQDTLLAITGGVRSYGGADVLVVAELIPDPTNPHDAAAIAVLIDDRQVGWMRHADAVAYGPLVAGAVRIHGNATCAAEVRGGWDRGRGDVAPFGVVLHLPPA